MVAPLVFYESKKEPPIAVAWECSFAFASNEYRLTCGCRCGSILTAHFGYKETTMTRFAGYLICPDCQASWYYEVPLTFVFRETNT